MNLEELEKQDMIRKFPVYPENVKSSLELARRDLETAKRTFETDHDWAFSIAYNSVLQAARALMFYKGYRPAGDRQHLSVAKFTESVLGDKYMQEIAAFDRLRRKRHIAVYDRVGTISEQEARFAIETAEKFLKTIEGEIREGKK